VTAPVTKNGRVTIGAERLTDAEPQRRHRRLVKHNDKTDPRAARGLDLARGTIAESSRLNKKLYGVIYADAPWRFEPYWRETGMGTAPQPLPDHDACAPGRNEVKPTVKAAEMSDDGLSPDQHQPILRRGEGMAGNRRL
jgi:hypothetical protein